MSALGGGTLMLAGSASAEPAGPSPEDTRKLRVGQTVWFDRLLGVTFVKVLSDSRCPINARCIWAGDAEVLLRVQVGLQKARFVTLHTYLDPKYAVVSALPAGVIGIPKSYIVRLMNLTPQPFAGRPTRQRDYCLTLGFSIAL